MEGRKGEHADIDDIIPIISVSFIINPEYPLLEPRIVISPFFVPLPPFSRLPPLPSYVSPFLSVLALLLTYPDFPSNEIAESLALRTYRLRRVRKTNSGGDPVEVVSRCGKKYDDSNDATTG
ncbi:hypothetical protein BKA82DRAFT_1004184 [Pisolithus tinctorius]|uniref:Uncharacterized protein n=1 Tax=Pisolithus tinctorius Marx 270 TaxID=870435 RepID=A0A0C3JRG0_PISTI|nr:hypothetical protein BKA82DRAFT_1004184 [Pisolithus tinctorius]KIO00067.1 hypothetical protein M404DRAFT_1004184 [Pisolithus tinctorius Marx 270]